MIAPRAFLFVILASLFAIPAFADSPPEPAAALQDPESLCRELYHIVCAPPGQTSDWDAARNMFLPDAILVMRVARDSTAVFSVQGWIDDFVAFDKRANVIKRGYRETVIKLVPMVFRDIAHVLVLYEAAIIDSKRPPTRGVDSFELVKKDGRWWIASVTNELPDKDHPLPAMLRE